MDRQAFIGKASRLGRRALASAAYRTAPSRTYTYLDAQELPEISRPELLDGTRPGIWYESGKAVRRFERLRPAFVDDPGRTGLFPEAWIENTFLYYPPAFALSGRDVTLTGSRSFLAFGDRFFNDDSTLQGRHAHWLDAFNATVPRCETTGFEPTLCRDRYRLRRHLGTATRVPGRTVVLVHEEPRIYGSWLVRVVAKLGMVEGLGLRDEPILAYTPYPSYVDALRIAGLKVDRLIAHDVQRLYRLDHAVVPGNRNGHIFLDPESVAVFARMREAVGYRHDGRKLYVARNPPGEANSWNGRVMLNEAELMDRLRALGFEIVVPARMSMEEQIRAFASAGFVLGPSGSAMFNAVFCQPGTRLVDIESEPHWINAHMCLFSSLKLDYGVFVGEVEETDPAPVHRRYRVDIPALIERINSFA